MVMTFRGISLRPVLDEDSKFLFKLFADPSRCHLWLRNRTAYDESGFQQAWNAWTNGMIGAKLIVESASRPVGLVFDYDRTLEDGWTKATTLLLEENVGQGGGVIATALFMDWLFQNLPLRKVYLEAYGYNSGVLLMWGKIGLIEEGILKGDRYWNGAYWDLHIFALYREAWPKMRSRVLRHRVSATEHTPAHSVDPGKEVSPTSFCIPTNGCPSGAEQARP